MGSFRSAFRASAASDYANTNNDFIMETEARFCMPIFWVIPYTTMGLYGEEKRAYAPP